MELVELAVGKGIMDEIKREWDKLQCGMKIQEQRTPSRILTGILG